MQELNFAATLSRDQCEFTGYGGLSSNRLLAWHFYNELKFNNTLRYKGQMNFVPYLDFAQINFLNNVPCLLWSIFCHLELYWLFTISFFIVSSVKIASSFSLAESSDSHDYVHEKQPLTGHDTFLQVFLASMSCICSSLAKRVMLGRKNQHSISGMFYGCN